MQNHTVLRTQKNLVLQMIQRVGLAPTDFAWSEVASSNVSGISVSLLTHGPTGYYFLFDFLNDKNWTRFSPSRNTLVETRYPGDWTGQLRAVEIWLAALRQETEEPDLWAMIESEKALALRSTSTDLDNTPFTESEKARISTAVSELRSYIETTNSLSQQQLDYVVLRLDHLEDSATRLGRKDWITLAIGALTNIIVGLALAPEVARDLLRTANNLLGWVADKIPNLPL